MTRLVDLKKKGKILYTDICADKNREQSVKEYLGLLAAAFENNAMVRIALNLFTMMEMAQDMDVDSIDEMDGYIDRVKTALSETIVAGKPISEEYLADMNSLRDRLIDKMKALTAYSDAFDTYEYVIRRLEPAMRGSSDENVDKEELSQMMYSYVFSQKDNMSINVAIQELVKQMPVRMSKQRFYDIISNALDIYKGSETKSVDDFVDTILTTSLSRLPDNFETEYRDLYDIYAKLSTADYKNLTEEEFDKLCELHSDGFDKMEAEVSTYMMLTDIVNDIMILCNVDGIADKEYLTDSFEVSRKIVEGTIHATDIYAAADSFDDLFVSLEGVQEEAQDVLSSIVMNLDELSETYGDTYSEEVADSFRKLKVADKLFSTSLYMDISTDISVVSDEADDIYISDAKELLGAAFDERFKNCSKLEKRSVMASVLSLMPVFFNSKQEIKEYFDYALDSCNDASELTALRDIVNQITMGS